LGKIDSVSAQFREILGSYTTFKEEIMKKYTILALAAILTASLLAGCRNPNMDTDAGMDTNTNPSSTSTPTGSNTEATTAHRETQPQTTTPTTLPQTDPTAESATNGSEETGDNASPESRFRRRMPGM
jgi:transcription initiation factor TFIIIB Brf1 subunit/transcription initiation factor TFIIB